MSTPVGSTSQARATAVEQRLTLLTCSASCVTFPNGNGSYEQLKLHETHKRQRAFGCRLLQRKSWWGYLQAVITVKTFGSARERCTSSKNHCLDFTSRSVA